MMSVIVDYTFKIVFLTFYTLQAGPPKRRGVQGNLPPFLLSLSVCLGALITR